VIAASDHAGAANVRKERAATFESRIAGEAVEPSISAESMTLRSLRPLDAQCEPQTACSCGYGPSAFPHTACARAHVLDHVLTQRADGIRTHGKLLSWMRLKHLDPQDRASRLAIHDLEPG
jgi:hypothetical protein